MEKLLKELAKQGCWPCVSRRSATLWRAHVNQTGNFWEEATTPLVALRLAVKSWTIAGKPMDGLASINKLILESIIEETR